jgi:hypothetical protein
MTSRFCWPAASVLLAAAFGLMAQEGKWTYEPAADSLADTRNDSIWTEAVTPAAPTYRLAVACDDTEYISVFVRSDAAIVPSATLRVRFDGGDAEVLSVEPSLANANRFSFEPAGNALRRMLASRTMVVSLRNKDLEEVPVNFDVTGFAAAIKQMPSKCQERFAERAAEGKLATKPAARVSRPR